MGEPMGTPPPPATTTAGSQTQSGLGRQVNWQKRKRNGSAVARGAVLICTWTYPPSLANPDQLGLMSQGVPPAHRGLVSS